MKKSVFAILIILAVLANCPAVFAYTIFNASKDGATLVGNNEDGLVEGVDNGSKVWFLPEGNGKLGRVFSDSTMATRRAE